MTDEEFLGLAHEDLAVFADEMDREHEKLATPALEATFRRTYPTYTETMNISGYPNLRMIVVAQPEVVIADAGHALPGVIRELPVGWRDMASAETFRSRFEQVVTTYTASGWTRA